MHSASPANPGPWLDQLALWQGRPAQYWSHLAQVARALLGARTAMVCWKPVQGEAAGQWQVLAVEPVLAAGYSSQTALLEVPAVLWQQVQTEGWAWGAAVSGRGGVALLTFVLQEQQRQMCILFQLDSPMPPAEHFARALAPLRWMPRLFEQQRQTRQAERDATRLAQVLETIARVLQSRHLDQASLVLCNDLAERFACEAVSLCWRAREGLKLRAISHTEKVDRRSELTALLEESGAEALQQEKEMTWPASSASLGLAHERYAQLQHPGHLYTLPLIDTRQSPPLHWGSLTLERQKMPFTQAEQWALRLYADLALSPLVHLHDVSAVLPVRLWREITRSLPVAWRVHTRSGRRLGQSMLIGTVALGFIPWPFTVSAVATVKTDTMAFVGAPFDGYLESSAVQLGESVRKGQSLFTVSTRELMLERDSIRAEMAQANRESEKRRAANQLPEMQMAESQVAQSQARLQQTLQRVQSAAVISPMDGVVVEGEPGKNLSGAVRRGDTIVKVAALSALYVEAAVSEKDLSRIQEGQATRVTLLAQPASTYALKVQRIIPQATVMEGANAFPVRLELEDPASHWWRPGMSGVAKISIGWRPLGWIATHRLIDYLRVALWV